ncbi:unnamed protein product [Cuscuta epithymum]|uniref:Uncharacterized protein n=1 Tax=Cuscuta epithymum TaxID=186058 RepID=A0AAV0DVA9_9ASTE|nr:unnamed protein product [Cuscuta epithymum]
MGAESWSLTAKLCDYCRTASATVFCRADAAFLCGNCDSTIHAANKLASRHARVSVCDVCEQAPASFTCKADDAALCVTCDRDIHSANPLSRRHERLPVVPFYHSADDASSKAHGSASVSSSDKYVSSESDNQNVEEEEAAEAASWLIPDPNNLKSVDLEGSEYETAEYLFGDVDQDPYLHMEMISCGGVDQKHHSHNRYTNQNYNCDGVVPELKKVPTSHVPDPVIDGFPAYDTEFAAGSKPPFLYNFAAQSISQSVSSASLDVGVVPDHNAMTDVSDAACDRAFVGGDAVPNTLTGADREARVLRYREKRKNRKFEKTIRYASRKAYAETRPRIKGRFAKRSEVKVMGSFVVPHDGSHGVVPSY